MNLYYWLPLLILCTSLFAGIRIFFLKDHQHGARSFVNLFNAVLKLILVGILLKGVYDGNVYEFRYPIFLGFDIILNADELSLLFISLSAFLWLLTTIYAIGYLKGTENQSRFFGFFSLCVSSTTGIALAGNLFTLILFYELLTLTTYPLVVHKGTEKALKAGRIYMAYTILGGVFLLVAMVWLSSLVGPADFSHQGIFGSIQDINTVELLIIFFFLICGFGVKAALVPFHGWLPNAMVAPAPVSALLHAVAVVKAGAFGMIRIIYDVYGISFCKELNLTLILAIAASITIVYGSVRALFQTDIKKRLAFSTVSQVSYILLGVSLFHPLAGIGGIVHLVHQGIMKITLFFCAGNLAETAHIYKIKDLNGIGRKMPWTMVAFSIACFGMIGVPPMAGFVSKWYIGQGALESHDGWVILILLTSSLLNAAYFLPLLYRAWFKKAEDEIKLEKFSRHFETRAALLFPPLITAALTIYMGLFASSASPLKWAQLIISKEFGV